MAKSQAKAQQRLDRTGHDLKVSLFQPAVQYQDYAVVSVEIVKSSDAKTAHWLMKWFLAAPLLMEMEPKHETSRMWFKTCASTRIRNIPYGQNFDCRPALLCNRNMTPLY